MWINDFDMACRSHHRMHLQSAVVTVGPAYLLCKMFISVVMA